MPPHTLEDWGVLIGIGGAIMSLIGWYMKKAFSDPLSNQMALLSSTIQGLDRTMQKTQNDVDKLSDTVADHEKRLFSAEKEVLRLEQDKVNH